MCSRALFTVLLSFAFVLSGAGSSCDLSTGPASWARVLARNAFFNAWEPNFDLAGFCVTNDFFSHSLNYSSHVNLANSSATVHQDVALSTKFDDALKNCGQSIQNVQWCESHCLDKHLETLIVSSAVINGSLPLATAQQVYTSLGSPKDTSIAAIQVDLSAQDLRIDYDYYDDVNFCSVFVKVKNPSMFPYAMFVTVQKVIIA